MSGSQSPRRLSTICVTTFISAVHIVWTIFVAVLLTTWRICVLTTGVFITTIAATTDCFRFHTLIFPTVTTAPTDACTITVTIVAA